MLTVLKRLKSKPDSKWKVHEIMIDKFPEGFHRELHWAEEYERRNTDNKCKNEYKVEVTT
jgi:hypothetical protein